MKNKLASFLSQHFNSILQQLFKKKPTFQT